jgi:transposase-like protein
MNSGQPYEPSLTDPKLEWRIKPTPREWWRCEHCGSTWQTEETARGCCRYNTRPVHVQEVLQ